jgi:hypothetical protein
MTTDEEYLTNNFNKFIKKWCGNMYAHLIDTDENDGEGFRGDIILTINKVRQEERAKVLAEVKTKWDDFRYLFLKYFHCEENGTKMFDEFEKKVFKDGK